MANNRWKKALLPSLASRHKDEATAPRRARLRASKTVSDIRTTRPTPAIGDVAPPLATGTDLDDRLVSDLLETTAGTDHNSRGNTSGASTQILQFTRSRTVGAMSSNETSGLSSSHKSQCAGEKAPNIPLKSSRRFMRSATRDLSASSQGGNEDGLARPLSTSQSISTHASFPTRRVTQSSTSSMVSSTGRSKRNSPISKGSSSPRKISHSATSVLTSSQDCTGSAVTSVDSGGILKTSRSRTKNVLTKFADALTEHFTAKSFRKIDKHTENSQTVSENSEPNTKPNTHGLPLGTQSLRHQSMIIQSGTIARSASLADEAMIENQRAIRAVGTSKHRSITDRKRLTVVDELDFKNGQALEDPFTESSSGSSQNATDFEVRLRSGQIKQGAQISSDPFQAERILETSVDAILLTPPVGCSTPRRRTRSIPRSETPTKASRGKPDHGGSLIASPPPSVAPERKIRFANVRKDSRKENQNNKGSRSRFSTASTKTRLEKSVSSDSTRLSSFPPGSTLRHVPRSMGRLTEAPTIPMPAVDRARKPILGRKKHPSPSKGQLELFGRVMEKNLALGVFKDVDELGMSFNCTPSDARTLSPRDSNRLMRNTEVSNKNLRKNFTTQSSNTGLPKSQSRIPKPVRQLSRSRTDTAFAREFIPNNKGDSTAGDELQWDASKMGHACKHCGSSKKIA